MQGFACYLAFGRARERSLIRVSIRQTTLYFWILCITAQLSHLPQMTDSNEPKRDPILPTVLCLNKTDLLPLNVAVNENFKSNWPKRYITNTWKKLDAQWAFDIPAAVILLPSFDCSKPHWNLQSSMYISEKNVIVLIFIDYIRIFFCLSNGQFPLDSNLYCNNQFQIGLVERPQY